MTTPGERAARATIGAAELALICRNQRRNQAVFERLLEAVEINPDLTATLLDRASSAILEEVARAASSRPVGRHGGVQRPASHSSRPAAPAVQPPEKDFLT